MRGVVNIVTIYFLYVKTAGWLSAGWLWLACFEPSPRPRRFASSLVVAGPLRACSDHKNALGVYPFHILCCHLLDFFFIPRFRFNLRLTTLVLDVGFGGDNGTSAN